MPRIAPRLRQALTGIALAVALGTAALAGTGGAPDGSRTAAHPELPGGGRSILPEHRVIAHYGAPQARELGILGIGTPAAAGARLVRQAAAYRALAHKPVLPAMELIATIASAGPGSDGRYRTRQTPATIRRYLTAARRRGALLILDIQPGRSDFLTEAKALGTFLREPDVGLALDPEWRMAAGQLPGKVIGSVDAAEINRVTAWLAEVVAAGDLPDKLVVIHQFTEGMIRRKRGLRVRAGIDMVLNADGFGTPSAKVATYRRVTRDRPRGSSAGFKLFFEEDTHLMRPGGVLRLRPSPLVVIYE